MAYKIDQNQCTGCGACQIECPNKAIYEHQSLFSIKANKCTECLGYFDKPQCIEVCPINNIISIDSSQPRYQAAA